MRLSIPIGVNLLGRCIISGGEAPDMLGSGRYDVTEYSSRSSDEDVT